MEATQINSALTQLGTKCEARKCSLRLNPGHLSNGTNGWTSTISTGQGCKTYEAVSFEEAVKQALEDFDAYVD